MRTAPLTAIVGVLCLAALGVATNVATSALPETWRAYLWIAWPVLAALIVILVVLEIRRPSGGSDEPPTSGRSRAVLLERVHRYWVKGVLERSFYQQARIELGLETTVEAASPWDVIAAEPDGAPRLVPPGTAVRTVFDDLDHTMLVLGAPGAGKTTMLLELLRDLLAVAATDDRDREPIPVMLNLTSWTQRQESLDEWVIREVSDRYQVSRRHVRNWLAADELLLVLDGLDEVAATHRQACVEAINEFRAAHGATPIAVGCRSTDYEQLHGRLRMYGTLRLQPLTPKQVESFLDRIGPAAAGARAALATDSELRELVSSPLMLSILMLAFHPDGRDGPSVGTSGTGDVSTMLWQTFVATMLRRRPNPTQPSRNIITSLAYMAANLGGYSQTLFTFDLIDKLWLPYYVSRRRLERVANMACLALGLPVLCGAGYALFGWRGAAVGLVAGLAFALPAYQIDTCHMQNFQSRFNTGNSRVPDRSDWVAPVIIMIMGVFVYPRAFGVAAVAATAAGILLGLPNGWLPAVGYAGAAAVAVLAAVWLSLGYAVTIIEVPARRHRAELPSPKVRATLRVGVLIAPLIGLFAGGLSWLVLALFPGVDAGPFALLAGIGATSYALTYFGFYALVEQIMIRRVLRNTGLFPLPARPLLDHATRCMFLHKVGDGYIFAHQSLLDFFTGLNSPDSDPSHRLKHLIVQVERRP